MTICDIHAYPLFFLSSPVTSHGIHCMSVFSWRRSRQQDVDVRTQMASEAHRVVTCGSTHSLPHPMAMSVIGLKKLH